VTVINFIPTPPPPGVRYSRDIEAEISLLSAAIAQTPALTGHYRPRWLAIQLLENDEALLAEVKTVCGGSARVVNVLNTSLARLAQTYGDDVDIILADQRYSFVNDLVRHVVSRPDSPPLNWSDRVDRVVTHRLWGIPIFLTLMWVVFKITTDVAAPMVNWVGGVIAGPLTRQVISLLGRLGLGGGWPESLLVDGVIAGVGGVLVFVPVLAALYLALAVLEDSGYMARAAFVMDRVMQKIGLHGKSFLPMVVGFGCSVPGVYATRTLENEKDRILTALLVPFMSCGARLPVYVLFASIFFPAQVGLVIFALYFTGIATAIGVGLLLRKTLFRTGETTPFLIELPPYRWPNLKTMRFYVWERISLFIHNAWTLILVTSIAIWFLMAIPLGGSGRFAATPVTDSAFGKISGAITPIFAPLGFGNWQNTSALMTGFVAKEVVVSTIAQVYNIDLPAADGGTPSFLADMAEIGVSLGQAGLDTLKSIPLIVGVNLLGTGDDETPGGLIVAVQHGFESTSGGHGALAALAFMVFVLLYTPCMVAVAAIRQELGTRWMWLSVFGQFAVAWLGALVVFQGGLLLGLG
jgi:ferrous iron transport protein B